ncbi:MAG: hypothetical protein KF770_03990, partial [Anaerolineae bacterium]|nr:hypothetical protein [Anaerolineae bacterium]
DSPEKSGGSSRQIGRGFPSHHITCSLHFLKLLISSSREKNMRTNIKRKIVMFILLIMLMMLTVITASAGSDFHVFNPSCIGPGGATTAGSVSPGVFAVAYVGSSTWTDAKFCNDYLGCVYFVRQPLPAGHYITTGAWSNAGLLDIWTGWCG